MKKYENVLFLDILGEKNKSSTKKMTIKYINLTMKIFHFFNL